VRSQLRADYEPPEELQRAAWLNQFPDTELLDIDIPKTKVLTMMDQPEFLNSVQNFVENFQSFLNPSSVKEDSVSVALSSLHDPP